MANSTNMEVISATKAKVQVTTNYMWNKFLDNFCDLT